MTEPNYYSPLLFGVIDHKDGGPHDHVATLNMPQSVYRKARRVTDAGYRLAIRTLPKNRYRHHYQLTVRNGDDEAITMRASSDNSMELHTAAENLIDHAHGLLFDPLPW